MTEIKPEIEMRPLWCREACWGCGAEGLSTRTIAKPKSEPYYCEACEIHNQLHAAHTVVTDKLEMRIASLERHLEEARREVCTLWTDKTKHKKLSWTEYRNTYAKQRGWTGLFDEKPTVSKKATLAGVLMTLIGVVWWLMRDSDFS